MTLCLLLLSFLYPFQTHAAANCPNDFHGLLKALVTNPEAMIRAGEKDIAGVILEQHQKFPNELVDGVYVYLTDSHGRAVYSPRVPNLNDLKNPLATHRSLTNKLKLAYPNEHFEILSAGEFEVSIGKVSQINNKAGTYRGKLENLEHAERLLSQRGLKIEEGTVKVDYSTAFVSGSHTTELNEAQLLMRYQNDPEFASTLQRIKEFFKKAERNYPSRVPGKPNWVGFYTASEPRIRNALLPKYTPEKLTALNHSVAHFLEASQDAREFYFHFNHIVKEFGSQPTREAFKNLERYEGLYSE